MISNLISPTLLRHVRSEIQNLSFTPKETDIYKIHQSGDLANLDGLEDSSLKLLPSLLALRDAMYSPSFRNYLSNITGSGPLSGRKTDMAINIYTPGCHLLCHDDVIGSRRVSYILYLTDPDRPWKKEWGGALRLYPTQTHVEEDGRVSKVPSPDYSVSIPPAFNQLSFFAVQPGESFHDVEEVYSQISMDDEDTDDRRARMAISGWYHIPQEEEEGYEKGLEERLAERSSLMQLQGKGDNYDLPKPMTQLYGATRINGGDVLPTLSSQEDLSLSEEDLNLLLKYIAPTYLTPDTLESVSNIFSEEYSLCLDTFLSRKFVDTVRDFIQAQEAQTLPMTSPEIEKTTSWTVARPPHKHRLLYQQAQKLSKGDTTPITNLLEELLPSEAFEKWLSLATGQRIISHNSLARRFRRGQDYTLATGYDQDSPRIEICLGITPTSGWGDDQPAESETHTTNEKAPNLGKGVEGESPNDNSGVGGYLAYMAGEDDDDHDSAADDETGSDHCVEVPLDMSTGARSTRAANPKKHKQDPAIYRASADDEDDGVLFSMPAGWNRLGVVLRDKGTMRFVKYVSRSAKGDRWDVVGEFGIVEEDDDAEEKEGGRSGLEGLGNNEDILGIGDSSEDTTEHDSTDDPSMDDE